VITRDELKKIFKLFRKHEDLLISAYLDNDGMIEETNENMTAIDALTSARLAWRPAESESVRFTRELSSLFERVLRDPRRLTVDADIGGFINSIESNVNHYRESLRNRNAEDSSHYISQIERLIDDLRSSLLDSSGQLWQKINSEFGYVASLELKIKENEAVLKHARRLNDHLELIKVSEFDEMAGNDPQLRRYIHHWLLDSVETCRRETSDAIHKLNYLLFEYREQERIGRLVDSFYRHYELNPGYTPQDYTDMGDIPEILNQVAPLKIYGHADIEDPEQEIRLTDIISGLRKEQIAEKDDIPYQNLKVLPDEEPIELEISPLKIAVEEFYLQALESNASLDALDYLPDDAIESDPEIWLYAIIGRFNNMEDEERDCFKLNYDEYVDPVFSGVRIVKNVHVSLRL